MVTHAHKCVGVCAGLYLERNSKSIIGKGEFGGESTLNFEGHLHFTGTELKSLYLMMGVTSGHSDGHVTLV